MTRLSNETVAEQTATLAGAAIMLLGLLAAEPGDVFATGIAMVHVGFAFSCVNSTRELRREIRLRYTMLSLAVSCALVGIIGWIVWDYTSTVLSFLTVIVLALLGYAAVYFVSCSWLRLYRNPINGVGNESTEP